MSLQVNQNRHHFPSSIDRRQGWSKEKRGRALLDYLENPGNHQEDILRESADTVLIFDKYPKAQVHLRLLPKWIAHREIHPHDSFQDPKFLAMVRREAVYGLEIAVNLLRCRMITDLQQLGMSAQDACHHLTGRDLSKAFQVGIHAGPSQFELHIHIISRDMHLKDKYSDGHYNSFTTEFFVPLNSYPLPWNSRIYNNEYQRDNLHRKKLPCFRCGRNFGKDWDALRIHLAEEWENRLLEEQPLSVALSKPNFDEQDGPSDSTQKDIELPMAPE